MEIFSGRWLISLLCGLLLFSCSEKQTVTKDEDPDWMEKRAVMVRQLRAYGIENEQVLRAIGTIHRHRFIPQKHLSLTSPYGDHPCPIGYNQTISQPYIVAYMTEKLNIKPSEKILEIGTGSGYQAAILAELGAQVYTIEIIPELADHARTALSAEGYKQVKVLTGDGYKGWPDQAPFDAIIVTCAPNDIPRSLVEQLKEGGRMILPLGAGVQRLVILRKKSGQVKKVYDLPVRFVPMVHGS